MLTRSQLVVEAKKRIGKRGDDLFKRYGTKTHWCLMQVYYLLHDVAGIKELPKTFSCSGMKNTEFAKKRMNHDYSTAEVGDYILFETNNNRADGPDHVGLVIENTGHSIKLLEGNTRGTTYLYYDSSISDVYEYSYTAGCFDCIIDMSEFFEDSATEEPVKEEPVKEPVEEPKTDSVIQFENRVLKKGMTGKDVKTLQQILIMKGYSCGSCSDDGDFGPKTESSVMQFQKERKLVPDGIVGTKTFTELWRC